MVQYIDLDAIVIGAGAVGLAVACSLARRGREVWVLEQESNIGTGISSRSSEVIHAGIYYPTGSLKAQLCIEGAQLLYRYCHDRGVDCRRLGKLIVAKGVEQQRGLEELYQRGLANGVTDLQLIRGSQIQSREPEILADTAIWSPHTGIVDSHQFMNAMHAELEQLGGRVVCHSPVNGGSWYDRDIRLMVGEGSQQVRARLVINAAGLGAVPLLHRIDGYPKSDIPVQRYAKGHYFNLQGRHPFRHLIYPMPEPGGLGVHLTLDLAGQARFGPDVEWIEVPDYGVSPLLESSFRQSIAKYWPGIAGRTLLASYAGIRPKTAAPGEFQDFDIREEAGPARTQWINLLGIESPGLTAAPAIGEYVAQMAR